jgi:hypothetical protein
MLLKYNRKIGWEVLFTVLHFRESCEEKMCVTCNTHQAYEKSVFNSSHKDYMRNLFLGMGIVLKYILKYWMWDSSASESDVVTGSCEIVKKFKSR